MPQMPWHRSDDHKTIIRPTTLLAWDYEIKLCERTQAPSAAGREFDGGTYRAKGRSGGHESSVRVAVTLPALGSAPMAGTASAARVPGIASAAHSVNFAVSSAAVMGLAG